ncbi:meprin A subunit beta [Oryzias melastigma]|uniref:Meprin A subunit n=1 Tax=Oryzias melastigma TaxID=30732 RepID=A0A3B3BF30_ORYME|nr:meprin A subunit beta [Oryzias melastigma]
MAAKKCRWIFFLQVLLCGSSFCLPTPKIPDFDVDGGRDRDIFDINEEAGLNLVEGDIVLHGKQTRNSIIGDEYKWPRTIPYYMEDDLEINAKGVILKAFEQYRLKSCIDFKPWSGEENYISIFKGNGCFSSVGNRRVGKQRLSIGTNCDRIATIEHEFLHALGFWHEQSRSDRDDYVHIMWDRILDGREHNFNTYNDTTSSSLGVPYDYGSMMHYSKNAFRNGSEPTIVTKIPAFSDVIGQRMEFSDSDLLKLHRFYNCTQGSTFLDSCDFERENICGMVQGHEDKADWVRVISAAGGPDMDYTNNGKCVGSGYFMHFNTGAANTGDKAILESRIVYPKRGFQCLQFFYYNSAGPSDTLKIHVREFDETNPNGTLRFITTIDGPPQELWQLHHVSLDVKTKFRVVFEGTKVGSGSAAGGLSLDDINLSETSCPEFIWRVKNFSHLMENTPTNESIFSPPFTSKEGYTFQMQLYPNGVEGYPNELSAYSHLVARDGDTGQTWPSPWKQMTMMLMDQHPHIQKRMSNQRSVTTDPTMKVTDSDLFFWDDPRKVGVEVTDTDGSKYFRGPGAGTAVYLTHLRARSRDFIKGGDAIFLLTMEDVSHLTESQPLPPTTSKPDTTSPSTTAATIDPSVCNNVECQNGGVCVIDAGRPACRCVVGKDWWYYGENCQHRGSTQDKTTLALASSLSVLAAMSIITAVSVVCMKKKYKKRIKDSSLVMGNVSNVRL